MIDMPISLGGFVSAGDVVMLCLPDDMLRPVSAAVDALAATALPLSRNKSYGELYAAMEQHQPDCYVGLSVGLLSLLRACGKGSLRRALVIDAFPGTVINEIEDLLQTPLWTLSGGRALRLDKADSLADAGQMGKFDNKLFAIGALVDYKLSALPGGYKLEGIYTGWMDARQVGDVCDGIVAVKLRELSMDDMPLYSGERAIE